MSAIAAEDFTIIASRRYRPIQVALHWLVAVLVIEQYATSGAIKRTHAAMIAGQPPDPTDLLLHTIHNRAGMAITGLMALRLLLRWRTGPTWRAQTFAARAAASAHAAFYGLIVAQGATGFIAAYFWWPISAAHVILFKALLALIAVHILAALWHHFARRDDTLTQMVPGLPSRSSSIFREESTTGAAGVLWPAFETASAGRDGRLLSRMQGAPNILVKTAREPRMAARWIALAMGLFVLAFVGLFAGAALWGPAGAPPVASNQAAEPGAAATRTLRASGWTAAVTVGQSQERSVTLTASIKDDQGQPPSGQPTATLSESGMGMQVAIPLQEQAPGIWRGSTDLPMAGAWSVTLELNGEQVSFPLQAGPG